MKSIKENINYENYSGILIDKKYIIIGKLGNGGFGLVCLVEGKKDGKIENYAIKINVFEECIEKFYNEKEILKDFLKKKNNYIPRIYEPELDYTLKEKEGKSQHYFKMDYFPKKDLEEYISKTENGFEEKYAKLIFRKILESVQYCHDNNICHLDIKTRNFVFDEDFNVKIIDFGESEKIIRDSDGNIKQLKGSKGTKIYKCPQMWANLPYNGIKADIFSLGVVLYRLVTKGQNFTSSLKSRQMCPYSLICGIEKEKNEREKNSEKFWSKMEEKGDIKKPLTKEFKELCEKMLAFDEKDRPESIKDIILNDPWMKETLDKEMYENLEIEVGEYLLGLENKDKYKNEELKISSCQEGTTKGLITKGLSDDINICFKSNIKPKKINLEEYHTFNYLKINDDINGAKFMNYFIHLIKMKYGKSVALEWPEDEEEEEEDEEKEGDLILMITFSEKYNSIIQQEKEVEDRKLILIIRFLEYGKDKYIIHFIRKYGEIQDFYEHFSELKNIIKNISNITKIE